MARSRRSFADLSVLRANGSVRTLPFDVAGPPLRPGRQYTLRVHVDVGHSGSVQGGDFVSTQSYPVQATTATQPITVAVRRVRPEP